MELHLVGWNRLYMVTPDQTIFSMFAYGGWNCTWLDGIGFSLSHLIRQFSQCLHMVVGIGVWLDGIAPGWIE
jgi:hypothetical protein